MASRVVPKKSSRSGSSAARRPQIDDAAAQGEIARLAHRAGAHIAIARRGTRPARRGRPLRRSCAAKLAPGDRRRAAARAAAAALTVVTMTRRTVRRRAPVPPASPAARFRYRAWARRGRKAGNPRPGMAAPSASGAKNAHGLDAPRRPAHRRRRRTAPGPSAAPRRFRRQIGVIACRRAGDGQPALASWRCSLDVPRRVSCGRRPPSARRTRGLSYSAGTGAAPRSQA